MTVIDAELDVFYELPDGYVWCIAGCSVIGEHNGHPCATCGGKGFMADPKTPGSSGAPRHPAAGADTPAGSCEFPSDQLPAGLQTEAI